MACKEVLSGLSKPNSDLESCFQSILKGNKVDMEVETIETILKEDINIKLNSLEEQLRLSLPYMLVHYIKAWPGWQKGEQFYAGTLSYSEWYDRFKRYLVLKVNYIVKSVYDEAVKLLKQEEPPPVAPKKQKELAPFSIVVSSGPKLLNTIVFSAVDDNIIMKQHAATPWHKLTLKQVINWPYIQVTFTGKDIMFSRRNEHSCERFISSTIENPPDIDPENRINMVEILNKDKGRKSYTYNLISAYFKEYLEFIKAKDSKLKNYTPDDVKIVTDEFLADITEISIKDSMATNTRVKFNIGNFLYTRSKKIRSNANTTPSVCYTEIITPKVDCILHYFDITTDTDSRTVSVFQNLVDLWSITDEALIEEAMPKITFRCIFCDSSNNLNNNLASFSEVTEHLTKEHCNEQPILCPKCKKQFDVKALTENRWKHDCVPKE